MSARFWAETSGTAALEFALVVPLLFALLVGLVGCGSALWVQLGLQHAVEMAARCASVNVTLCPDTASIQKVAIAQSYGVNPPANVFAVSKPSCGYLVKAKYDFALIASSLGLPQVTLSAQSCFPT